MHPDMRTRVQVALQILNFIHSTQSKQPRRSTLHNAGIIPQHSQESRVLGCCGLHPKPADAPGLVQELTTGETHG